MTKTNNRLCIKCNVHFRFIHLLENETHFHGSLYNILYFDISTRPKFKFLFSVDENIIGDIGNSVDHVRINRALRVVYLYGRYNTIKRTSRSHLNAVFVLQVSRYRLQ